MPAPGKWAVALEKLRSHSFGELVRAALPNKIDMLLYVGDRESLERVPGVAGAPDVPVERYDAAHGSGVPEIDARISGSRQVYVVHLEGRVAHVAALAWDILLPSEFGFDPATPIITDGYTWPEFRGRRLQPLVRHYIVKDVLSRGLAKQVYVTMAPDNIASQHGNERGGMRLLGRLRGYRIAGVAFGRRVL